MSLSHPATEKIRGTVVAIFSPLWETLLELKNFSTDPALKREDYGVLDVRLSSQEEIQRLQIENQRLKTEVSYLQQGIHSGHSLLSPLSKQDTSAFHAFPARIIFRPPDAWNNSFWINVGEANNATCPFKIISKNSPVLVGNSIIGVIDYVGQHQSRVRLITDPGLNPSVRVARGGLQEKIVGDHIDLLLQDLKYKTDLIVSKDDKEALSHLLKTVQQNLRPLKKSWYLAKGVLQGSTGPSWRIQSEILKGTGFNFDFDDEEGEARDLRTGKLIGQSASPSLPILRINDILVTTGMDGVFPPGLQVARVTKIQLLKEGDYFYDLEAKPTAGHLNDLSTVFVIPPVGFDKQDQPQPKGRSY